jgi:hypothetical protein
VTESRASYIMKFNAYILLENSSQGRLFLFNLFRGRQPRSKRPAPTKWPISFSAAFFFLNGQLFSSQQSAQPQTANLIMSNPPTSEKQVSFLMASLIFLRPESLHDRIVKGLGSLNLVTAQFHIIYIQDLKQKWTLISSYLNKSPISYPLQNEVNACSAKNRN